MPRSRATFLYLNLSLASFIIVGLVTYFWPKALPFRFFEFWEIKGSLWEPIYNAWPLFLFGIALNAFGLFSKRDEYKDSPGEILLAGFGISMWAGAAEEICFRWLIFLNGILVLPLLDGIIHWCTGMRPIQDIYAFLCPIANFFTLGHLEKYLMNGHGWEVAAALMSSNGQFRNGHFYQGLRGATISWFAGMYFFWVMFNYGLIAGIIIHFLYDFFIFMVVCVDATIDRARPLHVKRQ